MKHAPIIGTVIDGRYQLLGLLGDGNMGAVYRARDPQADCTVAIKMMKAREPGEDDTAMERFRREARASSAIDSEHLTRLLGAGVDAGSGQPYIVMEHLVGEDLAKVLERLGPLLPDAALRIAAQACAGLSRAHAVGVVHRDIKPANLFLAEQGDGRLVVKVLDFGVAKLRADQDAGDIDLTGTGHMLGSPLYMAPEQVRGARAIDHRADLWSLGIVLYRALSGRAPHQDRETLADLVLAVCTDAPAPLRDVAPWVSSDVAELVHHALEMDPDRRFGSAAEMLAALRAHLPFGSELRPATLRGLTAIERATVTPRDSAPPPIRVLSPAGPVSEPEPEPPPAAPALRGRVHPWRPRRISLPLACVAIVVGILAGAGARWATRAAAPQGAEIRRAR